MFYVNTKLNKTIQFAPLLKSLDLSRDLIALKIRELLKQLNLLLARQHILNST